MRRLSDFSINSYETLSAMKFDEYKYWQQRPDHERIAAVSEITTEAYQLKDPAFYVSRLQRTLIHLQQA
ncbi:conserved hypothetical protein [Gammaproteobacteria bacterium]